MGEEVGCGLRGRAGGWLVDWEEAEGEEGAEGSRGWFGGGADWCWCVDRARGCFVFLIWHGSHPFLFVCAWLDLWCAPGAVWCLWFGSAGGLIEVEDGGAVAADLVDFEIELLGGLADGVSGLEERLGDLAAGL